MTDPVETHSENQGGWTSPRLLRARGVAVVGMGCLAVLSPLLAGTLALLLAGLLLIASGVLEMLQTFRTDRESERRLRPTSATRLSVLARGFCSSPSRSLVMHDLALFVAGSFLVDAIGKTVAAVRARVSGAAWKWLLAGGLINAVLALVLVAQWPVSGNAVVAILVGIRMVTAGWSMLVGRESRPGPIAEPPPRGLHPDRRLRLAPHAEFAAFEESLPAEEANQRWINAVWCWTFVAVFFAIHIGRMNVEWNLVGIFAPLVAVVGDVATALIIAFGIILPCRMAWRKLTRPVERRAWERLFARGDRGQGPGLLGRVWLIWLGARLRFSWRMARARHSPQAALNWGLQVGLPATAILIAVNPIWGFSWFFNSESWTTGIWDRWAEARTDIWREKMIEAVRKQYLGKDVSDDRLFAVEPEGAAGSDDFSFLVLGDTGEGGAAQQSLRDQYLFLGRRPDVKFLVISSDVIYPEGAMPDYEPKFYLPFKGFTKPIYALPGNHDWYDALEAFAANFLEPDAARASMHARMEVDNWWTTTTSHKIEAKIQEAARLRREFGVSTGSQRGPFFEVQTGQVRTDRRRYRSPSSCGHRPVGPGWKAASERSRGKFIMVILGHPPLCPAAATRAGPTSPLQGNGLPRTGSAEAAGHRLGARNRSLCGDTPFAPRASGADRHGWRHPLL